MTWLMRRQLLQELGQNIKKLRLKRNLTQEALAEKSGCHTNYIGGLERGERNPTITKLMAICWALNCKISELTDGLSFEDQ